VSTPAAYANFIIQLRFKNKWIERISGQEFSRASIYAQFSVTHADSSADNDNFGHTVACHTLENVEIASVMMRLDRDGARCFVVPNDNVSICTDRDGSFAWVEIENFR
jgi:hypothetical protein